MIGEWVRRAKLRKWHLVESIIADDAVTQCGKRMHNESTSYGSLVFKADPVENWTLRKCLVCSE